MSKQDRQKLSVLIILSGVLVLTLVLGYRMNKPVVTAAIQVPETKPSANPPAATDARIRLDLIEKPEDSAEEIGRKNVFQYRQTPAPVSPSSRGGSSATIPLPSPPDMNGALAGRPLPAITPPGPPPIPFKYQGYAVESSPSGQMIAFLTDEAAAHHYNVGIGEVLMGRYRITQIAANSVEVEDIENNRRQTLPLAK
jgi:hypothetical protein